MTETEPDQRDAIITYVNAHDPLTRGALFHTILEAKLAADTELSLGEIADMLGFGSHPELTHQIQQYLQKHPGEWDTHKDEQLRAAVQKEFGSPWF